MDIDCDRDYRSTRKAFFDQIVEYRELYAEYGNQERLTIVAAEVSFRRENFRAVAQQYGATIQPNEVGKLDQFELDCERVDAALLKS